MIDQTGMPAFWADFAALALVGCFFCCSTSSMRTQLPLFLLEAALSIFPQTMNEGQLANYMIL
jgi:hypothetical protein